ncbi:MAG TPA: fructose PTS transporter subunit IIA [Bacillales bacterium]|nr:fructose PTS transporter subunit IIA [Bacillales bacterium]
MIEKQNIIFDLHADSQEEAIRKIVEKAAEVGKVSDIQQVVKTVLNREAEGTTGFGKNIAIPHGKSTGVNEPILLFAKTNDPLEWESMDGEPVQVIFMILVPEESHGEHLQLLAKLARKLMHDDFVSTLKNTDNAEDLTSFLENQLA